MYLKALRRHERRKRTGKEGGCGARCSIFVVASCIPLNMAVLSLPLSGALRQYPTMRLLSSHSHWRRDDGWTATKDILEDKGSSCLLFCLSWGGAVPARPCGHPPCCPGHSAVPFQWRASAGAGRCCVFVMLITCAGKAERRLGTDRTEKKIERRKPRDGVCAVSIELSPI